jgi:hypothetical protein
MVPVGRAPFPVTATGLGVTHRPARPDVVIGGAPRSGTTFLCELLDKHPDVHVARPFIPEPKVCLTPHPDGDPGILGRYLSFFDSAPDSALRVEKTSYYFENAAARERLARLLPGVRYIFILREPVARAYSNWRWSSRNGIETLPFADAIAREGQRPSPFPPEMEYVRPFDYMTRGRYGTLAEAWLRAVGVERVAFYLLEDVVRSPESFVERLQRFIGVRALPWADLFTAPINPNAPGGEGLDASVEARLRRDSRAEVERFAAVTGIDVSVWGY